MSASTSPLSAQRDRARGRRHAAIHQQRRRARSSSMSFFAPATAAPRLDPGQRARGTECRVAVLCRSPGAECAPYRDCLGSGCASPGGWVRQRPADRLIGVPRADGTIEYHPPRLTSWNSSGTGSGLRRCPLERSPHTPACVGALGRTPESQPFDRLRDVGPDESAVPTELDAREHAAASVLLDRRARHVQELRDLISGEKLVDPAHTQPSCRGLRASAASDAIKRLRTQRHRECLGTGARRSGREPP